MKKTLFVVPLLLAFVACSQPAEETAATKTPAAPAETINTVQADTATLNQTAATDTAATDTAATETAEPTNEKPAATETTAKTRKEKVNMDNPADLVAEMKTQKGTIVIGFYPKSAPNTVKNFIELASEGFYNGTKFHRVIPGFMIQGGDPNTKTDNYATWGTGGSGKNIKAEFNDISHKRGIVSMARSADPDSASSQFFIVVKDSTFLDHQYTAFGKVLSGMSVADAIVSAPRNAQDRPDNPVAIESVTIRPATAEEKAELAR